MFVFLVVLITLSSTLGKKNTSCGFEDDMCGWSSDANQNCRWEINSDVYHGNEGYIYLNGTDDCSCSISWEFESTDIPATNNLTIEYYVFGPGPFSLEVSDDNNTRSDWNCSIQPGNRRMVTHVSVPGSAEYLHIKGAVTSGSRIIITEIWNSLQGNKPGSFCSLATLEESGKKDPPRPIILSTISSSTLEKKETATSTEDSTPQSTSDSASSSVQITISSTNADITTANGDTTNTTELDSTAPTDEPTSVTYITTETGTGNGTTETETGNGNGTSPESTLRNDLIEAEREKREEKKKKTKKMIIGGVFGVLGVNIVIVAGIIFLMRRRRKRRDNRLFDQPIRIGINSNVSYDNEGYGTVSGE